MLLCPIQKTANFQHNGGNALNAHRLAVPVRYGFLVGLVSCMLCGHGSASESCEMRKPTTILLVVAMIQAILHKTNKPLHYEKTKNSINYDAVYGINGCVLVLFR